MYVCLQNPQSHLEDKRLSQFWWNWANRTTLHCTSVLWKTSHRPFCCLARGEKPRSLLHAKRSGFRGFHGKVAEFRSVTSLMACTQNKFLKRIFDLGVSFYTSAFQNYLHTLTSARNLPSRQTCFYFTFSPTLPLASPHWKQAWSNWNLIQCAQWSQFILVNFIGHDAFIRTNYPAIAMMFIRMSVSLGWACIMIVRCTLVQLSLWLDSLGTLTPKHVHLFSAVFFHFHLEEK